jgi:hypothetical protein
MALIGCSVKGRPVGVCQDLSWAGLLQAAKTFDVQAGIFFTLTFNGSMIKVYCIIDRQIVA